MPKDVTDDKVITNIVLTYSIIVVESCEMSILQYCSTA